MAELPAPPKKEFIKYQLDDQAPKPKKLAKTDSLEQVRKDLNLSEPFVFVIDGSELDTADEADTTLEEILADKTFYLKSTKPIPPAGPVVRRFAPPKYDPINSDHNGLRIYQYPRILIRPDPEFPGCSVISEQEMSEAKVMILMGQTGTGKSTTINAMVNFLMGVHPDDDFRYELIIEDSKKQQSKSQTTSPNIYCVRSNIGYPTVVIIDTPGYGDTGGLEKDQQIDEMVKDLFKVKVELVNLVCFVVKASMNRIGAAENYVYSKVLNLFGKDIGENFQFLITFADGGDVNAEPSLKAPESIVAPIIQNLVDKNKEWKSLFNNSAVFKPVDAVKDPLSVPFWGLYSNSMKSFFQKLLTTQAKSLMMTREVIKERGQLEVHLCNLNFKFGNQINQSKTLRTLLNTLEANFSVLNTNKEFQTVVNKTVDEKQMITNGSYTTYCTKCYATCHPICAFGYGESKENCAAMRGGYCTSCPKKCHHTEHVNVNYILVPSVKAVTVTAQDMKDRYSAADKDLTDGENLILGVLRAQDQLHLECLSIQEQMRLVIKRLSEIALRPNCYDTTSKYIEMMISNEESNPNSNPEKIKLLKDVLAKNEYADKIMKDDPSLKDKPKDEVLEDLVNKGIFRKTIKDVQRLLGKK